MDVVRRKLMLITVGTSRVNDKVTASWQINVSVRERIQSHRDGI